MKRYSASKAIIERLEKGPANPTQLGDELHFPYGTVMHNLRTFLPALGLVKQLPDGKYAMRWQIPDEYQIKISYDQLHKKLLRNPSSREIAGLIKKGQEEVLDLLIRYIPSYHEPSEEEIQTAAKELWKMVICYAWLEMGLPTSKKYWFERGMRKVVVEGVDSETVDEILKNKTCPDKAQEYLKDFPKMKPEITFEETGYEMKYIVKSSSDLIDALYPMRFWSQTTNFRIPLKYDSNRNLVGSTNEFGFDPLLELAELYSPSSKLIDMLLSMVGRTYDEEILLRALKELCKNGIEVEQMDPITKGKIESVLLPRAFKLDVDNENLPKVVQKERELAFDIIEMLNIRDGLGFVIAKEYLIEGLNQGRFVVVEGPNLFKVGKWLAQDPVTRDELIKKTEEMLEKVDDDVGICNCSGFLKLLLSMEGFSLSSHG